MIQSSFFSLFFFLPSNIIRGLLLEGPACRGRVALGFVNRVHPALWGRDWCFSMRPSNKWNFPNGDFGDGYYEFVGFSFLKHCFISQSVKLSKSHPGRMQNHHKASTSRCLPRSKQLLTGPAVSSSRVLVWYSALEALGIYFHFGLVGFFFFCLSVWGLVGVGCFFFFCVKFSWSWWMPEHISPIISGASVFKTAGRKFPTWRWWLKDQFLPEGVLVYHKQFENKGFAEVCLYMSFLKTSVFLQCL